LKRTYATRLSPADCQAVIRDCVDLISFNIGVEAFTGWAKLSRFSISYKSGKMRRFNPIFNKAIGRLERKGGKTIVTFTTYKGLTDLFSLLFLFIGSFLIIAIASRGELGVWAMSGLSPFCCFLAATITFALTWISDEGREGERQLIEFLERNLELENIA